MDEAGRESSADEGAMLESKVCAILNTQASNPISRVIYISRCHQTISQ